jgi:hypothetical protein
VIDYTIWAIKGARDEGLPDAERNAELRESLKNGIARFGWSYVSTADLTKLQERINRDGWDSLSDQEKDCYQPFLLEVQPNDWWVYINVPQDGRCCAARVIGRYNWLGEPGDFNHSVSVDPVSFFEFSRGDAAVHPYLKARLMLQGRKWRINARDDFERLVECAHSGRLGTLSTPATDVGILASELEPVLAQITSRIQRAYPHKKLEFLLEEVFRKIPGTRVTRQGGAGDHGADIIVEYDDWLVMEALLPSKKCVVQVKSYEGEMSDTGAVDDIRRAFEQYPDADMGLIVSTAEGRTQKVDAALDELKDRVKKPVGLLLGRDLARFVLRYGLDLVLRRG